MSDMPKDYKLSARVPAALVAELEKLATRRRRTRSEIVQFALEDYVEKADR